VCVTLGGLAGSMLAIWTQGIVGSNPVEDDEVLKGNKTP
jgi:hypothetical protein